MRQPKKGADGVYDFDALVHEPRLARVGGEIVDVAIIPVSVTLALAKFSDRTKEEIINAAEEDAEGELRRVVGLVSAVCVASNPKLTVDFLMEHLSMEKLRAFNQFVLQPLEEASEEGNATATE
jgi:hypothetical protein